MSVGADLKNTVAVRLEITAVHFSEGIRCDPQEFLLVGADDLILRANSNHAIHLKGIVDKKGGKRGSVAYSIRAILLHIGQQQAGSIGTGNYGQIVPYAGNIRLLCIGSFRVVQQFLNIALCQRTLPGRCRYVHLRTAHYGIQVPIQNENTAQPLVACEGIQVTLLKVGILHHIPAKILRFVQQTDKALNAVVGGVAVIGHDSGFAEGNCGIKRRFQLSLANACECAPNKAA